MRTLQLLRKAWFQLLLLGWCLWLLLRGEYLHMIALLVFYRSIDPILDEVLPRKTGRDTVRP